MVNPRHKLSDKFKNVDGEKDLPKNATLQLEILKLIAIEGVYSNDSIKNIIKRSDDDFVKSTFNSFEILSNNKLYQESILRAINKLSKRKMIGLMKEEPQSGGPRKYFGLTDKSITWLIENGNLSLEEFWTMIFNFFNTDYQYHLRDINQISKRKYERQTRQLSLSIDSIFEKYENIQMRVSRKYFAGVEVIQGLKTLGELYEDKDDETYQIIAKILHLLTDEHSGITEKKLHQIINTVLADPEQQSDILFWLDEFLDKHKVGKSVHYKVTFDGILLLFLYYEKNLRLNYLEKLYNSGLTEELNSSKINDNLDKIKAEYKDRLPRIFSKWKELIKIVDMHANGNNIKIKPSLEWPLLSHITEQYQNDERISAKIYSNDSLLPLVALFHMEKTFHGKFYSEYDVGIHFLYKWIIDHNYNSDLIFSYPNNEPSEIVAKMIGYDVDKFFKKDMSIYKDAEIADKIKEIEKYLQPIKKIFELGSFLVVSNRGILKMNSPMQQIFLEKLYDRISFYFYIRLGAFMSKDSWKQFLSNNPDINQWLSDWLDFISEFEGNNLTIIKNIHTEKILKHSEN